MKTSKPDYLINTIEEYEYHYVYKGYLDKLPRCVFTVYHEIGGIWYTTEPELVDLLLRCDENAPELYAYIERVEKSLDSCSGSDRLLMEALEAEGFDFMVLLKTYFDFLDPEEFYENVEEVVIEMKVQLSKDGPGKAEITQEPPAEKPQPAKGPFTDLDFWAYADWVRDAFYQPAKALCLRTFRKSALLDDKEYVKFLYLIEIYGHTVGGACASLARMSDGVKELGEPQLKTLKEFEPAGKRAKVLARRFYEPNNPPFTLSVLEVQDEWDTRGEHTAQIWAKATTADGFCYVYVRFSDFRDEAYLYFPDVYQQILDLEARLGPHEAPVAEALWVATGDVFSEVVYSYAQKHVDVKVRVLLRNIRHENGSGVRDEYEEYLAWKDNPVPDNWCKWKQMCTSAEDELLPIWMKVLRKECGPLFKEGTDPRLQDWAIHEVTAGASNLFHDLHNDYDRFFDGVVIWGKGLGSK